MDDYKKNYDNIAGRDVNTLINSGNNTQNYINPTIYQNQNTQEQNKIKIKLVDENIYFANWGVNGYVYKSYQTSLLVDNADSSKPDFISVAIEIEKEGKTWIGNHFIFSIPALKPDERYKIDPYDIKEKVDVFVSDSVALPGYNPIYMEQHDILEVNTKVIVKTRSGKIIVLPIKNILPHK